MMDLRVSAVLLFVFLTGGYSLRCYLCTPNMMGSCDEEEPETCPYGDYKCASGEGGLSVGINWWKLISGPTEVTATYQGCLSRCKPGRQMLYGVSLSIQCCDTDFCNAPGYSLKCFSCQSDSKGVCNAKDETCPAGNYKCETSIGEITVGSTKVPSITKGCSSNCKPGINYFGKITTCCNTDFCNAANAAVNPLRCYSCMPDSNGFCDAKETICPAGHSKCESITAEIPEDYTEVTATFKRCASQCVPGSQYYGMTTTCCDTDLCNAADGMYKGSFLLLFSPLLFYFMFQ